jgi:hypothetical protein
MNLKTPSIAAVALILLGSAAHAADRVGPGIRFRVVNASPHTIREVYVCPSTTPTWGPNLLTQKPLKPGMKGVFRFKGGCGTYDVRLVADQGVEFLEEEVEFCDDDDVITIGQRALSRLKQRDIR